MARATPRTGNLIEFLEPDRTTEVAWHKGDIGLILGIRGIAHPAEILLASGETRVLYLDMIEDTDPLSHDMVFRFGTLCQRVERNMNKSAHAL